MKLSNPSFCINFAKLVFAISCFIGPNLTNDALAECETVLECAARYQCDFDDLVCQQSQRVICGQFPTYCPSRPVFTVWRPAFGISIIDRLTGR